MICGISAPTDGSGTGFRWGRGLWCGPAWKNGCAGVFCSSPWAVLGFFPCFSADPCLAAAALSLQAGAELGSGSALSVWGWGHPHQG